MTASRGTTIIALLGLLAAPAGEARDRPYDVTEQREACREYDPQRRPLFGDTHVHTAYSFDAATQNTRGTPADAYRFAKGETIGLKPYDAEGRPLRTATIDRPLDWTAVTDHSEMLGEVRTCLTPGQPGYESDACWFMRNLGPMAILFASRTIVGRERFRFCGPEGELCAAAHRQAWGDIQRAAEAAYDRTAECSFTSFVGYEWTASVGNGENLHRNVLFRNAKVPAEAMSWVDTPSALDLWKGLERTCVLAGTGCDVLTIPHNSNLSGNGLMFAGGALRTAADGDVRDTKESATLRRRYEPLVEIMQHKGDSECLLQGDTTDEACGFEKLAYDSFAGVGRLARMGLGTAPPGPVRAAFVREALKKGLAEEARLGVNPLQYGIVASTDTHLATPGLAMEYDPKGHGGAGNSAAMSLPVGLPDDLEFNPGGLAVAWAEENSRDAIFAALARKETYGTSGTRPVVRFFGGWDYPAELCDAGDFPARGYAGGVPMGGDLPPRPGDGAPRFAVWAAQDPGTEQHPGTPLQRVQIVKGWLDRSLLGSDRLREEVFDVAGGDNGASVDLATCQIRGRGSAELCSVWTDPDFDPRERAFYYVRVLENPTCRWSQRVCNEAGVDCSDPTTVGAGYEPCCSAAHRRTVRERAWTSPIWYRP